MCPHKKYRFAMDLKGEPYAKIQGKEKSGVLAKIHARPIFEHAVWGQQACRNVGAVSMQPPPKPYHPICPNIGRASSPLLKYYS